MKLLKQFIQQETVLTAAAVLAVVSAFFVLPDAQYLGYIDLRTLAILFSLMTVMAGLRRQGFFDGLGRALLSRTHSTFQLTLVLVGLCFFGSMLITNDVSLLTFVPFTFVVLSRLGADVRRSLLVPVVCMQTIAANLGSMLTPIGNPQNLYLYGKSGMSIGGFVLLMLPYTLVSLLLLLAWAALVCRKASAALSVDELVSSSASQGDQKSAADIRSQTAQDHERKGNEGQQGNIVGDEHASEKAQPDQYQRQLKGAVGTGQQCPAQSIKKALPPQPGHDRHQGKQDRQRAQVDVAEILRIRRNKEGGDNGQHSGRSEDRFLLNELFEFHRDTSL